MEKTKKNSKRNQKQCQLMERNNQTILRYFHDIHTNTSQFTATRRQKRGGTQDFKTETARTNFNQPAFV